MAEVVLLILLPMAVFGVFALLALRFGAETRPGFDERPVRDDRPNWPPIARRPPSSPPLGRPEPRGGPPALPVSAASASARGRPSRSARPASA